jgi:hypothetical protein
MGQQLVHSIALRMIELRWFPHVFVVSFALFAGSLMQNARESFLCLDLWITLMSGRYFDRGRAKRSELNTDTRLICRLRRGLGRGFN